MPVLGFISRIVTIARPRRRPLSNTVSLLTSFAARISSETNAVVVVMGQSWVEAIAESIDRQTKKAGRLPDLSKRHTASASTSVVKCVGVFRSLNMDRRCVDFKRIRTSGEPLA